VATGIDPASPLAWLYLGLNAHAMSDDRHAEDIFEKAINLAGDQLSEANYLIRKGYVTLGRILVQSGRNAEAAPYLKKARELQKLALKESYKNVADVQSESGVGTGAAVAPYVPPTEQEFLFHNQPGGSRRAGERGAAARSDLTVKEKAQADAQEKQLRAILGTGFQRFGHLRSHARPLPRGSRALSRSRALEFRDSRSLPQFGHRRFSHRGLPRDHPRTFEVA